MKQTHQKTPVRVLLPFLASIILSGCMVGPNYKQPAAPNTSRYTSLPLPTQTISAPAYTGAGKAQRFVNNMEIRGDWWHIFHSKKINTLVAEGIANSPTLAAAKATLREAKDTLYGEAGALMLPSADFIYDAQRLQTNALSVGLPSQTQVFSLFDSSIQSSYLLDIWGQSRRTLEGLLAKVNYEKYELMGAYLTLTSNIVTDSVGIASLEAQIKATKKTIQAQRNVLNITKKQLRVGGASEKDVLAQQTLLAQTQATLPPLVKSLSESQHGLAVLLGIPTSKLQPTELNLDRLNLPRNIPVSLPSKLVQQRPDIQAAAALLHEATAQVGVKTAQLLPQINLTAMYGFSALAPQNLFDNINNVWSLIAGLTQPLFHGGQLVMQRRAAIAALDSAAAQYKETVLKSFKSVSDALRAIQIDAYEFKEQSQAERAAKNTLDLTTRQFQVGGENYLSVLNAQQQYEKTVVQRVKAQAARYSDTAALYESLGGGWWNSPLREYGKLADHTNGSFARK